jgi:hypothetical protein
LRTSFSAECAYCLLRPDLIVEAERIGWIRKGGGLSSQESLAITPASELRILGAEGSGAIRGSPTVQLICTSNADKAITNQQNDVRRQSCAGAAALNAQERPGLPGPPTLPCN